MSYTHHVIARIDQGGNTTYLNAHGSWHDHPAEATPFYNGAFAATAAQYVRPGVEPKYRLEVMEIHSVAKPMPKLTRDVAP